MGITDLNLAGLTTTALGNGGTEVTVTHNLGKVPAFVFITPLKASAMTVIPNLVTKTLTTITFMGESGVTHHILILK
jgi:hypothetical protein